MKLTKTIIDKADFPRHTAAAAAPGLDRRSFRSVGGLLRVEERATATGTCDFASISDYLELFPEVVIITPMRHLDSEIDRLLTLLRNTIRARGFTQLQVQEVMGWGKSYISQLLTKQKKIRVDQVLKILSVIGADPAEFYAELYQERGPGRPAARPPAPLGPTEAESLRLEFVKLKALLDGTVTLLLEKNLIASGDLRAAALAAEREIG